MTGSETKREDVFKKVPVTLRDRLWELTGTQWVVWLCFLLHSDAEGKCWPSAWMVNELTLLARPTIFRALKRLVELGWLERLDDEQTRGSRGQLRAVKYRVTIPSAPPWEELLAKLRARSERHRGFSRVQGYCPRSRVQESCTRPHSSGMNPGRVQAGSHTAYKGLAREVD